MEVGGHGLSDLVPVVTGEAWDQGEEGEGMVSRKAEFLAAHGFIVSTNCDN